MQLSYVTPFSVPDEKNGVYVLEKPHQVHVKDLQPVKIKAGKMIALV